MHFWDYMITCWENGFAQTKWRGIAGVTWETSNVKRIQITSHNFKLRKGQSQDRQSEVRLNTGKSAQTRQREGRREGGRERDRQAAGQTVCSCTVYMQLLSDVSACTYVCARSSCLQWASNVPALQVGFAFLIDTVCSD